MANGVDPSKQAAVVQGSPADAEDDDDDKDVEFAGSNPFWRGGGGGASFSSPAQNPRGASDAGGLMSIEEQVSALETLRKCLERNAKLANKNLKGRPAIADAQPPLDVEACVRLRMELDRAMAAYRAANHVVAGGIRKRDSVLFQKKASKKKAYFENTAPSSSNEETESGVESSRRRSGSRWEAASTRARAGSRWLASQTSGFVDSFRRRRDTADELGAVDGDLT